MTSHLLSSILCVAHMLDVTLFGEHENSGRRINSQSPASFASPCIWSPTVGTFEDPRGRDGRNCERNVGGLQYVLGDLDTTNHLISCKLISLDRDEATSAANMQGSHVLANASGGSQSVVAGRHDYQPKRTPDGRRIGNEHISTLSTAA